MATIIILIFIIGYVSIVLEDKLRLDKTISALAMGTLSWAILSISYNQGWVSVLDTEAHLYTIDTIKDGEKGDVFNSILLHHIGKIAEIFIFLVGAMAIVELIDLHKGFSLIKDFITTRNKKRLLWIITGLGFILSAVIDNLTATIVLIAILRKLIPERNDRIYFSSIIILATNAGGAWSPIGDITTTMLWIGNKVSALSLIECLVIPSLVCYAVPIYIASKLKPFQGEIILSEDVDENPHPMLSSRIMLWLGLGAILFVPVFKSLTHLPPYIGMMLSLSVVWLVSERIHPEEDWQSDKRHQYSAAKALSRIEFSSILFFLGILLAVAALETLAVSGDVSTLAYLAGSIESYIPNQDIVIILLGISSAVIDNVPLVAAAMGMYNHELDHSLWHFIAYTAGTGGSMLIIGSAAGVAAMGMEKIDFIWYLKNIAWLAAIGFVSGCITFLIMKSMLGWP